ncbi:hypothetical protein PoB_005063800 [Plakobranchus ocellatus]|uniref:Uncharacterized protein n=1 Tax=Plakobranchus ocellatus TaxID=259542 RepID=A0AAV4BZB1_9GAST|nr:hypothetical protein PoB_005063800 [Plakobranchus ocellatus]
MTYHEASLHQSATLMVVTFLMVLAICCKPGLAYCEDSCERSIPDLVDLRRLWAESFSIVGNSHITIAIPFEHFLLSLVTVPENASMRRRRIRNRVLDMIGRYEDCVRACEHHISKRRSRHLRSWLRPTSGSGSRRRSKLV